MSTITLDHTPRTTHNSSGMATTPSPEERIAALQRMVAWYRRRVETLEHQVSSSTTH